MEYIENRQIPIIKSKEQQAFNQIASALKYGQKGWITLMAQNNRIVVPGAKNAMEQFKMQAASEVGVNLNKGYNGDLTSRQAGSIGGQMVKKMIERYENDLSAK